DTNNCELDGDLCTIDTCVAGVCNTDNVMCLPDEECATFTCNPTNGMCLASAINEGLPCSDEVPSNECTDDVCMATVCEHLAVGDGTPCTDDGNECSDDICLAGMCEHPDIADGIACTSDMIECTLDACLAGFCDHDPMNAFCDDALFCTGTETCDPPIGDPVTGCFTTGEPCDMSSESCCEDVDVCAQCCVDSQCDDFDNCTTDSCDAGTCRFDPVVCPDDGLFCTGVESCNPATGQCVSSGPPCLGPAGVCCDATDTCVAECCSDTDCVDSDGCTGEVCSSGLCFHPPVCGACCVSDPVPACSDGITSRDCASLGGDFKLGEVCVGDANGNGVDETCETVIPTVSQWGLIVLTLLLLAGAKIRFGRRRATA
ncbi:MAG: IPTL-CTERM sorting domain-containing protein, partial [Phycisphaerae bacterium]